MCVSGHTKHLVLEKVVIRSRFCGPPASANGGYAAGLIAKHITGAAQVTLFSPPPLELPMAIIRDEGGKILLINDGDIVAEAQKNRLAIDVPPPPSYREAVAASERFSGFTNHLFPGCFVCGPDRLETDGMRIFAGPLTSKAGVAAYWVPDATITENSKKVGTEFIWSALDCAGYFACQAGRPRHMLLGRFSADIGTAIELGKRYIITGWKINVEGRKHFAGTAIFTENGELCAWAEAIWISPKT